MLSLPVKTTLEKCLMAPRAARSQIHGGNRELHSILRSSYNLSPIVSNNFRNHLHTEEDQRRTH